MDINPHKPAGGIKFQELNPQDIPGSLAVARSNDHRYFIFPWHAHQSHGLSDLSFLDPAFVNGLFINFEWLKDHTEVNRFRNMDIFMASYLSEPAATIDLGNFPRIRVLSLYWNRFYRNINQLKELARLDMWYFKPRSRDLREFSDCNQLFFMTLIMASIDNVDGIEGLRALRELRLANNRTLKRFFTTPEKSRLQLEELCIEICKHIDLETLPRIDSLQVLRLIGMGKVPTLKTILPKFPRLESLVFTQSELVDGNIDYLLEFPSIKRITIDDKRHYTLKEKDINKILVERNV